MTSAAVTGFEVVTQGKTPVLKRQTKNSSAEHQVSS
jgi:hypothetical protein